MPTLTKKSRSHSSHARSEREHVPRLPAPETRTPEPLPPTTPQEACRRAMDAIVASFAGIIEAQIEKANEGSHQHAKFLCEFAGLSGALVSPAAAEDDSLARLLLDKLQIGNEDFEPAPDRPSSMP